MIRSIDPNDKSGPAGAGGQHYVRGDAPISYEILFENKSIASAPAQQVVVTDQLDVSKFDLSTFALGDVNVGSQKLSVPQNKAAFNKDFDLRPINNVIARITAGLDTTTGVVTWRFQSIDPATGQPTEDPLAGFLPPNVTAPQGEGSVSFTIALKPNLATETTVRNKARIVFDTNAPIDTPEWLNTLDVTKPVSSVQPLPAHSGSSFSVSWAGTDVGSGIASYTIYVSDNGGVFAPVFINSPLSSDTFNGQAGHTYRFYSIARDGAGNDELTKTTPEATVTVNQTAVVSGKVLTPDGRGVRNTTVSITDPLGVSRTAITSSFGLFSFDNVTIGQSYTFRVSSRLYRFAPRTVLASDDITLADFVGLE